MVFQKIVCLTLNIGILDMKGGCPKKPTKDKQTKKPTKDKQKTSVLEYWVRGYARQMIFFAFVNFVCFRSIEHSMWSTSIYTFPYLQRAFSHTEKFQTLQILETFDQNED